MEDLKAVAVYARDRINPYLFNYALSVALLHRPDTKGVDVPSFVSSFPDKFVDGIVLERLREEIELVDTGSRVRNIRKSYVHIFPHPFSEPHCHSSRLHCF